VLIVDLSLVVDGYLGSDADKMRTSAFFADTCGHLRTHADKMRTHADRRGQKNPTYKGTLYLLTVGLVIIFKYQF
jgi:hypothetical protein